MIEWILRQLERQPSTLFYEKELRAKSVSEFEELKARKLLTCVQPDSVCEPYGYGQQNALIAINLDGHYYALDDDNNELLVLNRSDLIKYQFCLEVFAGELAKANAFSGPSEKLHRRMYYAGERIIDGRRVALVLAFIDQEQTAEDLLLGLPARLPGNDHFIVVIQSFKLERVALGTQLEAIHIHVMPLEDFQNLKLDMSMFAEPKSHSEPVGGLNVKQEEEFIDRHYKCHLPITITSETVKWHRNKILINGFTILLGDSLFLLFLRLMLGIRNSENGAVTKAGLCRGGFIKAGSEDQTIGHLRAAFAGVLGDVSPYDFIESYGRGAIRLSTHPALVKYDKQKLSNHNNTKIKKIADLLP
jgi:hypothetical protein